MSNIVFVTGGCRSGKSRYAQKRAEQAHPQRVYVATCPRVDDEIRQRIERHQEDRVDRNWTTIEEPVDIAKAISLAGQATVLVDCLTLWVSNLMGAHGQQESLVDENQIIERSLKVVEAARNHPHEVVVVTNEVGSGIVPANALARRFRDLMGRCNQTYAREADEVVLMVSGIPVPIKNEAELE